MQRKSFLCIRCIMFLLDIEQRIRAVAVNRALASNGFLPVEGLMSVKEFSMLQCLIMRKKRCKGASYFSAAYFHFNKNIERVIFSWTTNTCTISKNARSSSIRRHCSLCTYHNQLKNISFCYRKIKS